MFIASDHPSYYSRRRKMEIRNEVSNASEVSDHFSVEGLRSFIEQFGIHLIVEVSIVSLLDEVLMNTAFSLLVGITLVEGCQLLWRRFTGA